jgi:hypothetical protein
MNAPLIQREMSVGPRALVIVLVPGGLLWGFCSLWGLADAVFSWRVNNLQQAAWSTLMLAVSLGILASPLLRLQHVYSAPEERTLERYGSRMEVVASLEADLDGKAPAVQFGGLPRLGSGIPKHCSGGLVGMVVVTRSWLLQVPGADGRRIRVMKLKAIVEITRQDRPVTVLGRWWGSPTGTLVALDQHGTRLVICGSEGGLARVMMELIARVPWALNRFDSEQPRAPETSSSSPQAPAKQARHPAITDRVSSSPPPARRHG